MSSRLPRHSQLIALNLALLVIASAIAGGAYGLHRNTLAQHPAWQSTKPLLAKVVMGAMGFVNEPQSVAKNHLDLGAWFGFHEVIYSDALNLAEMNVAVRFDRDGYVCILYDVRPDGFSGVRFSDRPDLPSIHFHASPDGAFLSSDVLTLAESVAPITSHAVRIRFESDQATIFIDSHSVGSFPRTAGPQKTGFRGGQYAAVVDNVVLTLVDGTKIRENFVDLRHARKAGVAFFCAAGLGLALCGLLANRQFLKPTRSILLATALASANLVVFASATYAYWYLVPKSYPNVVGEIKRIAEQQMVADQQRILAERRKEYGDPAPANTYRILFLGSSQTWGAGASRPEDVWVRQLEQLLNSDSRTRTFQCINGGVSGLKAAQVTDSLTALLPLNPQAVVINLSSNDVDPAALGTGLTTMVAELNRAGIRTILLQEPNSPERKATDTIHGDLAIKHKVVEAVGKAHGVPVINLQQYLAEKNQTGFLWWDFVHLTSFGHRLLAEKLHHDLPPLLQLR